MKNDDGRKSRRKFRPKFPENTVPSKISIHKLNTKVRTTGSGLDKKPAMRCRLLTEGKLDEMEARSECTLQNSL